MDQLPRHTRFRWFALSLIVLSSLSLLSRSRTPGHQPAGQTVAANAAGARSKARISPTANPVDHARAPSEARAAPEELFTYVPTPVEAGTLETRLPAPATKIHYVKINQELLSGKASPFWRAQPGEGRIVLPLPNGTQITLVIDKTEMVGAQRFISEGRIEGRPGSRVIFASDNGVLHALIEDPELGTFNLRYGDENVSQFYAVDPRLVGNCAGGVRPVIDTWAITALAERKAKTAAIQAESAAASKSSPENKNSTTAKDLAGIDAAYENVPPAAAATAQTVEVQLMMLYTPDVLTAAGSASAVQSAFDLAVATVNSDFSRSNITARIKLVKVALTNYNEQASAADKVQSDALTALANPSDGKIDEIHALRDQVGADLVDLVINRADSTNTVGIAYMLQDPSLATTSEWEYNPIFGFSVVRYAYINSNHVLSHELGHNFGCAHDRENAKDSSGNLSPGGYPYSYGYRFTGKNGVLYHDIMSYDPGLRLGYFSNPDVTPTETGVGNPIGIAPGQAGESDTALTIEKDAFEVSTYRLQQQAQANRGTLINVATLAYVGTGDQQLIGGFVVSGTQPKNMLVRAAGPGLTTTFGLGGVLADPTMSLIKIDPTGVQPPVQIGTNNDWNTLTAGTPNVGDLATAFTQAGAFAFTNGSKDAAIYASLNPGNYTVNITGANNTTGTALVEAYEVGSAATKIVNLATRGYIASDKPMVAGFVISGNAGETKRVLIRVRGPSLAQFGLTGADDPVLSLYNAASQLIVMNDDFSTDGTSGDSYLEQQIIATGYAPSNRREPCILIDLLPGVYTAKAVPFESLPSQPAAPGLAVIEVFEIN